ncbi:MAG: helicase HerA-like domain-containing protein [Methanospirillum sp.]
MPSPQEPLVIAIGSHPIGVLPGMLNRHGLVTGATGTGKTVTLRVLAEQLSDAGIPVVLADVKGDLSGLAFPGAETPKVAERIARLGLADFKYAGVPVIFWDAFGAAGHPVRTTVSEIGPLLFSRILDLNEVQSGVLAAIFAIADDAGLLLLDLKDLRAVLTHVSEHASDYRARYGTLAPASIGAIQRGLLALEQEGGDTLFGEPALRLDDLMRIAPDGRGTVSILAADRLMQAPRLYSTLLLYLLGEFYENLPEIGDPERPRVVVVFDEAHLLFADAPKVLLDRIEQMVRLIRSKGVGIWFVTQSPLDIPETVLGQLGNRVQHALRSFTPKDQRAVRTAAETLRPNPGLDAVAAITELGVGEALVSVLDANGTPTPVERAFVVPPRSRLAPLSVEERDGVRRASPIAGVYETTVDRASAYEALAARVSEAEPAAKPRVQPERRSPRDSSPPDTAEVIGTFAQSAARGIGSQLGRQLIRGLLGSVGRSR